MVQRKNPFVRVKQYYYEDGGDVHWWIDEDDLEDFKSNFCDPEETDEENLPKLIETREISGRDWNKFIVEDCTFDDCQGNYIDEDCDECGSFLVHLNDTPEDSRICSECDYQNDSFKKHLAQEEEEEVIRKSKPESPKFREPDLTVEQFAKKYHLQLDRPRDMKCVVCKDELEWGDYFIQNGYAIITEKHKTNTTCHNGPCIATPFSKKEKEAWSKLF